MNRNVLNIDLDLQKLKHTISRTARLFWSLKSEVFPIFFGGGGGVFWDTSDLDSMTIFTIFIWGGGGGGAFWDTSDLDSMTIFTIFILEGVFWDTSDLDSMTIFTIFIWGGILGHPRFGFYDNFHNFHWGGGYSVPSNYRIGVFCGIWSKISTTPAGSCITDSLSHTTYVESNEGERNFHNLIINFFYISGIFFGCLKWNQWLHTVSGSCVIKFLGLSNTFQDIYWQLHKDHINILSLNFFCETIRKYLINFNGNNWRGSTSGLKGRIFSFQNRIVAQN